MAAVSGILFFHQIVHGAVGHRFPKCGKCGFFAMRAQFQLRIDILRIIMVTTQVVFRRTDGFIDSFFRPVLTSGKISTST
jgi:hypothetical protein